MSYRILRIPDYLEMYGVPIKALVAGWETRGRSGGVAYATAPRAVGVHHTAGGDGFTANRDWQYYHASARPIGNGTMFRDGSVMVGCSGPSNTQGAGGPVWTPRGSIPLDSGNSLFVSWEATNDGVSQAWTDAQIANYPKLVAATLHMLNDDFPALPRLTAGQCFAHFDWTNPSAPYGPSRKPDPWGPAPPYATAAKQKWDMDVFRGRVAALLEPKPTPTPKPTPQPEDDDMLLNNRILADIDSAPPVKSFDVNPPNASTSRWFTAAVLAAMFKQLTGSKLYTQAAAEKLNALLKD